MAYKVGIERVTGALVFYLPTQILRNIVVLGTRSYYRHVNYAHMYRNA